MQYINWLLMVIPALLTPLAAIAGVWIAVVCPIRVSKDCLRKEG